VADRIKHMTGETRKQQIVQVTLELVAKYGTQGTTMSRIAAAAGIRPSSLYNHFKSRREILLASLDAIYERINETHRTSSKENVLDRLREMCNNILVSWVSEGDAHLAHVYLEFIASARSEGTNEIMAQKKLATVRDVALMVEEGRRQGSIGGHVDPDQAAWLITGWALTGDISQLLGVKEFFRPSVSAYWLDFILDSLAPRADETASEPPSARFDVRIDTLPCQAASTISGLEPARDGPGISLR